MTLSEISPAYHRNGVAGEGFHVITFQMQEEGERHNMVGILFGESGQCAVLDVDLLAAGNIAFGENSWRGDHFERELRAAIEKYNE